MTRFALPWPALAALAIVIASSCDGPESNPEPMSDADKKSRIDGMYADYRKSFPLVPEVTADSAHALAARGEVVLVDVRTSAEQQVSMIPGAITREAFEATAESRDGVRVVTYCTIGYRSGLYAQELRDRGIDAANLVGSVLAWTHAGYPLVHDGVETKRVHVYGKVWDLAAGGYESVW